MPRRKPHAAAKPKPETAEPKARASAFHDALLALLESDPIKAHSYPEDEVGGGVIASALKARHEAIVQCVLMADTTYAASDDEVVEACQAALCSPHLGHPSDLATVRELVSEVGGDCTSGGSYAALSSKLSHGWFGACVWDMLLRCDAAALRAWAGDVRVWWAKWKYDGALIMWPRTDVSRTKVSAAALRATGDKLRVFDQPKHMWMELNVSDVTVRELVGSMALVLCAVEPTCRALAAAAGLPGCDGEHTVGDGGAADAAAGAGGSADGGDSWGLLHWDAGSEARWAGCDLPKPVQPSCQFCDLNVIALRKVTGAQLAHGIAIAQSMKGRAEGAYLKWAITDARMYQDNARAWEGDDDYDRINRAKMMLEQHAVDVAGTASWCDDSHVGAALRCVAAALVQLHGERALAAVAKYVGRASPQTAVEHSAGVLWGVEQVLGAEAMPVSPALYKQLGLDM